MLRKADNVNMTFKRGLFATNGWQLVYVGRTEYPVNKVSAETYNNALAYSATKPWRVLRLGSKAYWLYKGAWYFEDEQLSSEDFAALIDARTLRRQGEISRARSLVTVGAAPAGTHRRAGIPDSLRQHVMHRDGGACRRCGSIHELQMDHIIPVSRGGATSAENLQVLCGPCNRRKGGL